MAEKSSRTGLKERLRTAVAARQAGDRAAAEKILRQILRKHPGQPDTLNLLGVLLAESGRLRDAIEHLKAAAAARPNNTSIRFNLAQALLAANRPGEAVDILSILNECQDSGAQARLLLVRALLADRRPEEAAAAARLALAAAPRNPELLTALGDALVQSERPEDALPHYRAAIAAAPGHGPAHNNLGTALERLGRPDDAAAALRRALEHAPQHAGARINLGAVYLRLGDAAAAEDAFAQVLKRQPYNQRAIAYRTIARQESGALSPETARDELAPLIHKERLGCPESFPIPTEFHETLAAELYAHPARRRDVSGTATTGGFDALRLFDHSSPALNAFEAQLRAAIDRHIARLPHRPGHPFLGRRPHRYELDVWATFLMSGGYQFPHLHPSGWISGVYYVQVPPSVHGRDAEQKGWIEFNRPDDSFDYSFTPEVIRKRPEAGMLLLFPSYAYHRTLPFESGTDRISIAFDVKPA